MSRFTNNGVSNFDLARISRYENARAIMKLGKRKIWIVAATTMSLELFSVMKFMCRDLDEFVNLIMFSSLNEIRQPYTTLDKRISMHISLLPGSFTIMSIGGHPDAYMT